MGVSDYPKVSKEYLLQGFPTLEAYIEKRLVEGMEYFNARFFKGMHPHEYEMIYGEEACEAAYDRSRGDHQWVKDWSEGK